MQVMDVSHSFNLHKFPFYGCSARFKWCAFHQHADAMQKSNTSSVKHYDRKNIRANWIHIPRFAVSQVNNQGSYQDSQRVDNVTKHMEIGCLHIKISFCFLLFIHHSFDFFIFLFRKNFINTWLVGLLSHSCFNYGLTISHRG